MSIIRKAVILLMSIVALVKVIKYQQQEIETLQEQMRYHIEQVHKDQL